MSLRIRDRLTDKDTIEARMERLRKAHQTGEYVDEFTTIPPEPWQVTLLRLPKCMRKKDNQKQIRKETR